MKTRNMLMISMTLVLLVGLFIAIGSVMAGETPPTNNGTCGFSGPDQSGGPLNVKKTVDCSKGRNWDWTVTKSADQSDLTLTTGQSFDVHYTVSASAVSSDTDFAVAGRIMMLNQSGGPVVITNVTDILGTVTCPSEFPFSLPAGETFECTYSGNPSSAVSPNSATVTYEGGSKTVNATIDWTKATTTETNECADVSDSFPGATGLPAEVCADGQTTFTFNYTRTIGPFAVCGDYKVDNTATVTPKEGAPSDTADETVNVHVPCAGGCSLTPGYWKTHSSFGPAPYDDTWALLGENTPFFFSGVSYYQALWTAPNGNAYWILAHAYIAAKLNQLNGADFTAAQATFNSATALFSNPTYTPAYIGGLSGSNAIRKSFIAYATILDNYNNGLIGPGHCSE